MRAIDADKLKAKIRPVDVIDDYCSVLISDVKKIFHEQIDNAPTITYADLVPHGRWEVKVFPLTNCKKVVCSECGYSENKGPAWEPSWGMPNFCPNCGARMDGGKEK